MRAALRARHDGHFDEEHRVLHPGPMAESNPGGTCCKMWICRISAFKLIGARYDVEEGTVEETNSATIVAYVHFYEDKNRAQSRQPTLVGYTNGHQFGPRFTRREMNEPST